MTEQIPEVETAELDTEQQLQVSAILPKLDSLRQALETENDDIENWIKDINNNLREFPELLHLLSDEQIQPIYLAYKAVTQVQISTKKAKSKKGERLLDDGRMAGDLL